MHCSMTTSRQAHDLYQLLPCLLFIDYRLTCSENLDALHQYCYVSCCFKACHHTGS